MTLLVKGSSVLCIKIPQHIHKVGLHNVTNFNFLKTILLQILYDII